MSDWFAYVRIDGELYLIATGTTKSECERYATAEGYEPSEIILCEEAM